MQIYVEDLLEMAPSDKQFDDLKKKVQGLEVSSQVNSWNQRNPLLTWLISLTLPIVAVILAIYAGVIPHIEKHVDDQVTIKVNEGLRQPLQKIGEMGNDIATIKATLHDWEVWMVPQILKQNSSLSRDDFQKSLPHLKSAIQLAADARIKVGDDTLQQIAQKLRQIDESSPDYWPTVLQFLQFASASLIAPSDVPPANAPYSVVSNVRCIGIAHCIVASHCAIILDGGHIPGSVFDHCRIKFTNNPVGLQGTRFTDCIFEVPTDITQPTPYLKNSAKTLLASNLRKVTFPI